MKKVGLITYHAAYNYGSVFQAYALCKKVNNLGYDCKIINYRMPSQQAYYAMYRTQFGLKTFIKDLLKLPIHKERKIRSEKFEQFIQKMPLTAETVEPEETLKLMKKYPVVLSGSDQIWNKHSCEMNRTDWKYMDPYLLKGYTGYKLSYASSVGNMKSEELDIISPAIEQFQHIAMRESSSAVVMSKLLNRNIPWVVDPTFLLQDSDWKNLTSNVKKSRDHYIFYYALDSYKQMKERRKVLLAISKKFGRPIHVLAPRVYYAPEKGKIDLVPALGPEEFLAEIQNADAIITDSYHGTILSVNLQKEVYSLCAEGGSEFRKTDILANLGLQDRIISSVDQIANTNFAPINYSAVNEKLDHCREKSLDYLKMALEEAFR